MLSVQEGTGAAAGPPAPLLLPIGIAVAALGSVCGIGGGLFAVPILHYLFRLPLQCAVATSLCLVAASSGAATVSEVLHPEGALYPVLAMVLIAAALVGTQGGYWLAKRIPTRTLKAIFCLVMLAVGARLVLTSGATGAAPLAGFEPGVANFLEVALIGLVAGVVVPLLGVGGGLVVVPALLFVCPEIGYLGARATSMAMAVVTAARSVWMYRRDGLVDGRHGCWFAAGALFGGVAGVWLVHLHGAAEVGQVLLGATLALAALRFGLDALRAQA